MLNIKETLAAFHELKVLVIGDVMLDYYLTGKINRISPEAPVPIVDIKQKKSCPGGAANVALNLNALGAKTYLFSVIGADVFGEKILDLLSIKNIPTKFIQINKNRRTTTKTRVLAQNQQIIRLDEEDTFDLDRKQAELLLKKINELLDQIDIDVILFQDYNKGILTPFLIRELLMVALRRDIPTVVDPKNNNFYAYKRATLFKPNLKEINDNLPFNCGPNIMDLNRAFEYLQEKMNNANTLVTLSENGIYFKSIEEEGILPTIPRKIADVCGAGDSVISMAALGIGLNLRLSDIALLANLAGGQVCEKVGVVPVSANQIAQDYKRLLTMKK